MNAKLSEITENDIFNFVFFNDLLSDETKKLIISDKKYRKQIEFYEKQKEEIGKSVSVEARKKLAALISAYKLK